MDAMGRRAFQHPGMGVSFYDAVKKPLKNETIGKIVRNSSIGKCLPAAVEKNG
jgi:hypothetical protein